MKPILLDTQALFWLWAGSSRLGSTARELADTALAEDELLVSAFSFWEIGLLTQKNRLDIGQRTSIWRREVLDMGVREVSVSGDIGILSTELEGLPADPADRIIVATALVREATLVTADSRILDWQGTLNGHDART